ncbi:MAG TPA: hypothetical protein VHE83_02245 [Mycobacteriales bacterium]|nr:hypothetical protein [Mycobacteriales bacterium]
MVDATWHVGAGAGQYASTQDFSNPVQSEWDPDLQHLKQASSYGIASRLSIRAIVLQSPGGQPVALVKIDNYLAQDTLVRRIGQLLAADHSAVTYDHVLLSATHDHSSPYYASAAAGVWLFQDVTDLRMFEYQARQAAKAIETAERGLRPARMGATTVPFPDLQGNIAGSGVNEDGSPVGYPLQDNDHGLVVLRFDDMSDPTHPQPLATWVNYAEHGESLDGYDLVSGDWIAPFERYVDRGTGVPVVFSQGGVGSAEGPYEHAYATGKAPVDHDRGDPFLEIYGHMGYAQAERGAHLMAERVIDAWKAIDGAHDGVAVAVPLSSNPPVAMLTHWIAGPLSHPYPSVGNCRSGPTISGDPGVPGAGLPDCDRFSDQAGVTLPTSALYRSMLATGLPIPSTTDLPSFAAVEENLRIKLQAVRIGGVLLASCACEPQGDLIRALETRTDTIAGNRWNGFDYANADDVREGWPTVTPAVQPCHLDGTSYSCPDPRDVTGAKRLKVSPGAFAHMEAEINNPSDGWDAPGYVAEAGSEPTDPTQIKGNFTARELSPSCGFALPVGLGHTGDYNGYTVSYREYMSRDAYRKALTSYGPHTADYMVSRLIAMASNLSCGTPVPSEPTDALATADEQREQAEATAIGKLSSYYYDGWTALVPDNAGPAAPLRQPKDITRFDAATFRWVGGDNWSDDPTVTVQRQVKGRWQAYADQSGEVQVVLDQPPGVIPSAVDYHTGQQRWTWQASFEAYDASPRADVTGGRVPNGSYRFVVDGHIHQGGAVVPYHLTSNAFTVSTWLGLSGRDMRLLPGGAVSFATAPVVYPRTYTSPIRFVKDDLGGEDAGKGDTNTSVICKTCTFLPWATTGTVVSAVVSVRNPSGHVVRTVHATRKGTRWVAATALRSGETAVVLPGGLRDHYRETNARPVGPVGPNGSGPPVISPGVQPPHGSLAATGGDAGAPGALLLTTLGLLGAAATVRTIRRRRAF